MLDPDRLAREFLEMAEGQFDGYCALYASLARSIAADSSLLGIARHAGTRPSSILFLGAVHYLLLRDPSSPLAAYYPGISPEPLDPSGAPESFHIFCLEHAPELIDLLHTRRVQTNEVRRCGCLMPAYEWVSRKVMRAPLSLVELGPSAGLNLLWDQYGYRYSNGATVGEPEAEVQIECELKGKGKPMLPDSMPKLATRLGIDLHPIDVRDADQALWLKALVWPEPRYRAELLLRAVQYARRHPPQLIVGPAMERLPEVIASRPAGSAVCISHSFVLNQFSAEDRAAFIALLNQLAADRPIYRVSMEWLDEEGTRIEAHEHRPGGCETWKLARCDAHGRWLEWVV